MLLLFFKKIDNLIEKSRKLVNFSGVTKLRAQLIRRSNQNLGAFGYLRREKHK